MDFRILGPLEVVDSGRPVPIGPPKERALLALLLLSANDVVSRDRLIDELWGEDPPPSAVTVLQTYVSHLRKALPDGRLVTRPPGYAVHAAPDELDLRRFERLAAEGESELAGDDLQSAAHHLREALALWRGSPLADFTHEAFAQQAIRRLEELRLAALESRIETDLALGASAGVIGELEALVREHPLRERFRVQLMLGLYRSGRQADALAVYQDGRRALVDGLGLEPSPPLQELERAILRQDPSLVPDPSGVSAPPESGREQGRAILAVPRDEPAVDALLSIAEPLARQPSRELMIARLLDGSETLAETTASLGRRRDELVARGLRVRIVAYTSTAPGDDAVMLATEQDVDLLLVDAPPSLLSDGVPDADLAAILRNAPSDVGVLVGGGSRPEPERPVIVPFGGADHDWSAIEVAAWIARSAGTRLQLAGTSADPDRGQRDASRLLGRASLIVQAVVGIVCEPVLVPGGADGVLAAAGEASLIVAGLSGRWRAEGLGPARLELVRAAGVPTLLVRRGLRPCGLAPAASMTRFTWTLGSES